MADKGFDIEEDLLFIDVHLNMPPLLHVRGKSQMSKGTTKSWNLKLETGIWNLFIEMINIIIIDGGPVCARNSNEHERERTRVPPMS